MRHKLYTAFAISFLLTGCTLPELIRDTQIVEEVIEGALETEQVIEKDQTQQTK